MGINNLLGAGYTRFKANFMLADRTEEYVALLRKLVDAGYVGITLRELAQMIRRNESPPERRVVLRHDIDSDPAFAEQWLLAEQRFGLTSSYYFRLRTLDIPLMKRIEATGSEASYHFEELASTVRRQGVRVGDVNERIIGAARAEFEANFTALKAASGLPLQTVASHGDFINRKLGITNSVVTEDPDLRERLGLVAEVYDPDITRTFDARISDVMGDAKWRSGEVDDPIDAISGGVLSIQILTHPRHWRAHILANLYEDGDRVLSSLLHALGMPAGRLVDRINRRPKTTA